MLTVLLVIVILGIFGMAFRGDAPSAVHSPFEYIEFHDQSQVLWILLVVGGLGLGIYMAV